MRAGIDAPRIERLNEAAAFQRLLRTRPRMISAHFAIHHLSVREDPDAAAAGPSDPGNLSTCGVDQPVHNVDDSLVTPYWLLGAVVPKRHARRAATRSLMKREIRAAFRRRAARLEPGAWVVRLRSAFDTQQFPSAASRPLMRAARAELDELLDRCLPSSAGAR